MCIYLHVSLFLLSLLCRKKLTTLKHTTMLIEKTETEIMKDLTDVVNTLIRDPSLSQKAGKALEKLIECKLQVGLKFISLKS